MIQDWWKAHRLEVYIDLVFMGVLAICFLSWLIFAWFACNSEGRKK